VGDSASLNIGGAATWTGTLTFHLCGPTDLAPTQGVTQTTCETGGTLIDTKTVTNLTSQPILSATTTVSAVGKYCWRADFDSGTNGVPDASDSASTECFNVIQIQPTIVTSQTMTIKDTATVTAASGAGDVTGTLRFRLYNNSTCSTVSPNELLYDSNVTYPSGITPTGTALSKSADSEVVTFTTTKTTLSWLVEFTSTNAGHKNVTSTCNTEHASLTIVNQ
jgi:hypothetical protein